MAFQGFHNQFAVLPKQVVLLTVTAQRHMGDADYDHGSFGKLVKGVGGPEGWADVKTAGKQKGKQCYRQ